MSKQLYALTVTKDGRELPVTNRRSRREIRVDLNNPRHTDDLHKALLAALRADRGRTGEAHRYAVVLRRRGRHEVEATYAPAPPVRGRRR